VNTPGVPAASADPAPDPHRPTYHFLPPSGWMNDPNGLLVVDGRLHLFYQHNPAGPFHDRIHWGHAVSDDLVHWCHLPIALTPNHDGPDARGCWSGCAVVHEGVPTVLYTGIHPQVQCLASGDGAWRTWRKHPTPVISGPPPGLPVVGDPPEMRDPWIWRQDDTWHMLLGSGVLAPDGAADGALLHYRSHDLRAWDYLGVVHRGRFAPDAFVWECPNLFELDGRHVVLVSEQLEFRHTYAQTGAFDGATFTPAWSGIADHGHVFYAGLTAEHPVHRRLLFGWIKERRPDAVVRARSRWSGALSLARVLGVDPHGRLTMAPAPEYAALRRDAHAGDRRRHATDRRGGHHARHPRPRDRRRGRGRALPRRRTARAASLPRPLDRRGLRRRRHLHHGPDLPHPAGRHRRHAAGGGRRGARPAARGLADGGGVVKLAKR